MKIQLTCKLFDNDAKYFIEPITNIEYLKKIFLYRDSTINLKNKNSGKVKEINDSGKLKFIKRFFRMSFDNYSADIYIGIYEMPHGLIALIASIINNKPVVVSIIGNPKYSIRNKGIRGFITNWIYKKASAITVTGSQSKQYLVEQKDVNSDKIFILPNSIPIEEFISDKACEKKYDLVTIGRLSPEKGLLNLLDIVNKLRNIIPDIKIGIAGRGPQRQEIQKKIGELNLSNNIDLLGYVESVSGFLNSGKLFITTSFTEGLPRTAIQSMIIGLPTIASNVGDISDLVIDGKTGSLINNPKDKDAFVQGVLSILNDDITYNGYSQNAMLHARKYYSSEAATKAWDEIFQYLEL